MRPEAAGFGEQTEGILSRTIGAIPAPAIFGAIAAAGIGAAFDIGEHFEAAYRNISKQTGETGAQLEDLEGSFKAVFAEGPDSMNKVADALALVRIRTKDSGDELDSLTESELKLARVTGGDVKTLVDETTKVFQNWNINGIGPSKLALDELLKVSEDTGISVDSLSTSIVGKAGAVFRQFNVDIGAAASIMGTLQESGVQTGPVVMGLARTFTTASKEGKDAHSVLADLFDTLKNGTPGTDAYNEAIKTLGQRGFASLADVVKSGKLTIEDFTGSMDGAAGTVDRVADANLSLGEKFDILKNKALVALEPIGMGLVNIVTILVDDLPGALDSLGSGISTVFDAFGALRGDDGAQGFGEIMDNLLGNSGEYVDFFRNLGDLILTVGGNLADFWSTLTTGQTNDEGTPVEKLALTLRETVLPIFHEVVDFVRDHWQPIVIGAAIALALWAAPITTIVTGIALLWANSQRFRDVVHQLGADLTTTASVLADVGRFLATVLGPPLAGLRTQIANFAEFFIDRWDKIKGSVETILKVIAAVIAVSLAPALIAWHYFHDQIMAVVKLAWDNVKLTIDTVVRILGDVFDLITSLLTGKWGDAWDAVKDIFGAAVDFLTGTLGNLLGFAVDFFSSLPGNIVSALGDLAGFLAPKAVELLEGLVSGLVAGVVAVYNWFTELPGHILSWMLDVDLWLVDKGKDVAAGLLSGIVEKAKDVWGWLTGLPGAIVTGTPDLLETLKDKGVDIVTGLWHGITDKFEDVKSWFKNLPEKLKEMFTGASKWLLEVGKSVLQGIVDGITSGADAIWNALKSAVLKGLSGSGGGPLSGPTGITDDPIHGFSHNAVGTNFFRGGLTGINEQGGEIIGLPTGSIIIPADLSKNLLRSASIDGARTQALLSQLGGRSAAPASDSYIADLLATMKVTNQLLRDQTETIRRAQPVLVVGPSADTASPATRITALQEQQTRSVR